MLRGGALPSRPARFDGLLIPGGSGLREPNCLLRISRWLMQNHDRFGRIASICTGVYALAASELCDERQLTTHWRFATDFAMRFPNVTVNADALFLSDGKFHSSGGVAAGLDLALALIEQDYGLRAATHVAQDLVVHLRRTGTQTQFSELLKFQSTAPTRLAEVCAWISGHLGSDLSVASLAQRANLSERQFTRLFLSAFGVSPARYVLRLRLDAARDQLASGATSIEYVA